MNWTPQNHQAALVKVSEIFDESQFKCWDELLYDLYQADLNLYPTKNCMLENVSPILNNRSWLWKALCLLGSILQLCPSVYYE